MRSNRPSPNLTDIILVVVLFGIISAWIVLMASAEAGPCTTVQIGGAIPIASVCQ